MLQEIGRRYGRSSAQVALGPLIENETVLPIPGAKNGEQAADNAEALSFALTPPKIPALDQATLAWRTAKLWRWLKQHELNLPRLSKDWASLRQRVAEAFDEVTAASWNFPAAGNVSLFVPEWANR